MNHEHAAESRLERSNNEISDDVFEKASYTSNLRSVEFSWAVFLHVINEPDVLIHTLSHYLPKSDSSKVLELLFSPESRLEINHRESIRDYIFRPSSPSERESNRAQKIVSALNALSRRTKIPVQDLDLAITQAVSRIQSEASRKAQQFKDWRHEAASDSKYWGRDFHELKKLPPRLRIRAVLHQSDKQYVVGMDRYLAIERELSPADLSTQAKSKIKSVAPQTIFNHRATLLRVLGLSLVARTPRNLLALEALDDASFSSNYAEALDRWMTEGLVPPAFCCRYVSISQRNKIFNKLGLDSKRWAHIQTIAPFITKHGLKGLYLSESQFDVPVHTIIFPDEKHLPTILPGPGIHATIEDLALGRACEIQRFLTRNLSIRRSHDRVVQIVSGYSSSGVRQQITIPKVAALSNDCALVATADDIEYSSRSGIAILTYSLLDADGKSHGPILRIVAEQSSSQQAQSFIDYLGDGRDQIGQRNHLFGRAGDFLSSKRRTPPDLVDAEVQIHMIKDSLYIAIWNGTKNQYVSFSLNADLIDGRQSVIVRAVRFCDQAPGLIFWCNGLTEDQFTPRNAILAVSLVDRKYVRRDLSEIERIYNPLGLIEEAQELVSIEKKALGKALGTEV